MKKNYSVSENTLMNVQQQLESGKVKTAPQIAKAIKRDYTTVYRAITVLMEKGKVEATKKGRFKFFSMASKEPRKHVHQLQVTGNKIDKVSAIQQEVRSLLLQHGPTPLVEVVKALKTPRGTTYAAIAEQRRVGLLDYNEGVLSLPAPIEPPINVAPEAVQQEYPAGHVVPGPAAMDGTPTGDLPAAPEAILGGLVKALTERALTEALRPLVEARPDVAEFLQASMKNQA